MGTRKRRGNGNQASEIQNQDSPSEQPAPQGDEAQRWDAPAFRNEVLWSLLFVVLPAIVMFALREYKIAAAWFGVGAGIIVFESRRQIRSFWRSFRSPRSGGRKDER